MTNGPAAGRTLGRYVVHSVVDQGGMATVYLARQTGAVGFARLVAVKALHSFLVRDAEFVKMFIDEARLAGRVRHPNVVATLDVIEVDGELLQVLEWVDGESLARLAPTVAKKDRSLVPLDIAAAILTDVLRGLHAAHEAKNERGEPLGIVHRDVSPQNVLVGAFDGIARVFDFGIAKAAGQIHTTKDGAVRGKLRYMPAEQLLGKPPTRANDIYAAGVVLWELITGLPMIEAGDEGAVVAQVLAGIVEPPSAHRKDVPPALDDLVLRALSRDPTARFGSARDMAVALEACVTPATSFTVSEWVQANAAEALARRAAMVAAVERAGDPTATATEVASALTSPVLPKTDAAASASGASGEVTGAASFVVPPSAPSARVRRLATPMVIGLVVVGVLVAMSTPRTRVGSSPVAAAMGSSPSDSALAASSTPSLPAKEVPSARSEEVDASAQSPGLVKAIAAPSTKPSSGRARPTTSAGAKRDPLDQWQ